MKKGTFHSVAVHKHQQPHNFAVLSTMVLALWNDDGTLGSSHPLIEVIECLSVTVEVSERRAGPKLEASCTSPDHHFPLLSRLMPEIRHSP
jgi:hypothetical protein